MKKHRKWTTIIGYCKKIPIDKTFITYIKSLLKQDKNILIMIKKENYELKPKYTPKEKFDALCKVFPKETKTGKIIISVVPDIIKIIELEF
jgi:hypothetical protein